jgi:hypothetical protein
MSAISSSRRAARLSKSGHTSTRSETARSPSTGVLKTQRHTLRRSTPTELIRVWGCGLAASCVVCVEPSGRGLAAPALLAGRQAPSDYQHLPGSLPRGAGASFERRTRTVQADLSKVRGRAELIARDARRRVNRRPSRGLGVCAAHPRVNYGLVLQAPRRDPLALPPRRPSCAVRLR